MKRKTLVIIHIAATAVAAITIGAFLFTSIIAEIKGDVQVIRAVKKNILLALPILIIAMPSLGITGNKLAGFSKNKLVELKRRRMRFVFINGMMLIALAIFLYYRSTYVALDTMFLAAQFLEFAFGITNVTLIILNVRSGLQLSGRSKRINS